MTTAKRSFALGTLYMLLSAGSLSLAYLFVKMSTADVPFFLLVFLRFVIPFLFLVLLFAIRRLSIKTQSLRSHFIRTLFVLTAQYSIFYYISKDTLLNATVLLNTGPLFIPLIEWLFLKYHIPKSTWISMIISAVGVFFILQPGASLFSMLSFLGLLAGFSQACSQVVFGLSAKKESPELNLFYLFGFGTVISFIPLIGKGFSFGVNWEPNLIAFVVLLSLASLMNQYFRAMAYMHRKPSTLSTFLYFSVLLSGFFDWFVFKKTPNTLSIIGAILVILGGISKIGLRYFFLKRKKSNVP